MSNLIFFIKKIVIFIFESSDDRTRRRSIIIQKNNRCVSSSVWIRLSFYTYIHIIFYYIILGITIGSAKSKMG